MNSNPHRQPSHLSPKLTDRSPGAQEDGSQLVVETERLHELRRQVVAQEQKLQSLRQQAANVSNNHVPSSADQDVMKSVIFTKERELALALMKVAELTSQLEHLRRTRSDDGRQSQRMLETNSQSKGGVIQKIIPIKLVREADRQSRDARRVSRQDATTTGHPSTDGSKGSVRVIPIVLEKTVSTSSSGRSVPPNAVQQDQGISTEKAFLSHSHPMQTEESSPTAEKGSNNTETSAETKKARRCKDVNENVDDGELAVAGGLSTGTKNGSSVECSAGTEDGRTNRSSEKVAVERVYVEKVGKANYCYEDANSEKVNVAVFDSRRSMETKFDDVLDVAKTSNVIDKTVVSKIPCDGRDGKSKLENAYQGSIGDEVDARILVKDKNDAVSKSHSVEDRTGNNMKENCGDVSTCSKNDGAGSSNNKNEDCKTKIIPQDRRSFFNFPLSNQLGFEASSSTDASAKNGVSNGVPCHMGNSSGRTSEPGFKTDRARFFMDMMKENASDTGVVRSWMEKPRAPISSEFRNTVSSIVSPVASSISRGRSSSSAIMSRFAPQPYGRSKSVDSGSLRAPLTALGSDIRRERSPEVTLGDADAVLPKSTTSCKMQMQHSATSSSNHHYSMSETPSVSSESHIQTEASVLSSRKLPYSLPFQKSVSSDRSPCRSSDVSSQKSFPEEKINVRSVPSPPVGLMSDSKPCRIETCQKDSAGGALLGDKVQYSMPSASGPVTVFSALQNLSSSAKDSSSRHKFLSATTNSATKVPTTDGISAQSARVTSPVKSVPCGILKSIHSGRPAVVSVDVQTGSALQTAKPPCTHVSSLNTTLLPNLRTLQQNLRSLPECHRPFTAEPGNRTSSSSLSIAFAKPDNNSSRSVDYESEEVVSNTACDSNVKRPTRNAVTTGEAVQRRADRLGDRELNPSRGITGVARVPLFSNGSNYSSCTNVPEHSRAENQQQSAAEFNSGTLLTAIALSKLPSQDLSTSYGFYGMPISAIQRRQTPQCSSVTETPLSSSEVVDSSVNTSVDSVSSALSVLLKGGGSAAAVAAHSSPVRPSRLRTTVSSAYRRKLGNGAMDNYSQNMTLLYGDCSAKKDDGSAGSDVQEPVAEETTRSSPVQDTPLAEDLPRILALDTLDGTPFYSRTGSHSRDIHGSGADAVNGKATNQHGNETELLKSGDVEVAVISSPRQTADLVRLDSTEGDARPLGSFNPPDDIVSSYIDDPSTLDDTRCPSETLIQPHGRLFTRRNGRLQRHVTFDQVSLLLSAALEGEKDLVVDIINKLSNPNQKAETGLSALHNAVCGNHPDVLKYLVEFGCDVNVADNDGWTPLHCAASTNNVEMLTILVENGASILPMTISDRENPVQKCSRNLPSYEEAVKYLTDAGSVLGVANDGWVYVTSNFTNVCSDELVLCAGEKLKILRRGDENESEWWWAKNGDIEGYVPQSLLALYPSIQPKWVK